MFLDSSTELPESHLISPFALQEAMPYKQRTAGAFDFCQTTLTEQTSAAEKNMQDFYNLAVL